MNIEQTKIAEEMIKEYGDPSVIGNYPSYKAVNLTEEELKMLEDSLE